MPLDPNLAVMLQFLNNANAMELSAGTVAEARTAIRRLSVDYRDPASLPLVKSVESIMVAGSLPARVYRPDGEPSGATVVYLHGGGFVVGDLDTHEGVCRLLAKDTGAVIVSIDYRLAPEHRYPAAVDDSWTALQWVSDHLGDFGGDPAKLAIGGDSAGGNLAAVCAHKAAAAHLPLAAQLLVYPAVDLLGDYPSRVENAEGYFLTLKDMQWFAANYLGIDESDPRAAELAVDPQVSPLRAPALAGVAPAVVATAEFDPLRDEGNRYAEALTQAGVPVRHRQFGGLIHGFYGMELISPAVAAASAWINAQVAELLA